VLQSSKFCVRGIGLLDLGNPLLSLSYYASMLLFLFIWRFVWGVV
jgi:hypothetical protein